jgi:integrase
MQNVSEQVEAYISYKQALGVKMISAASALRHFAKYANSIGHVDPIDVDTAISWATSGTSHSHGYEIVRYGYARRVAAFSNVFDPDLPLLPEGLLGKGYLRVTPYIFSDEDMSLLIHAANHMEANDPLAPITHSAYISLLRATGMRPGEALALRDGSIDFGIPSITVDNSKGTTRLLPIAESTSRALLEYMRTRDRLRANRHCDSLFLTSSSKPLRLASVSTAFQDYRHILLNRGERWAQRAPRLYDIRHTFVCSAILKWYEDGVDINTMLPVLATYLGHKNIGQTYWYLTGTPELMEIAANSFANQGFGEVLSDEDDQ